MEPDELHIIKSEDEKSYKVKFKSTHDKLPIVVEVLKVGDLKAVLKRIQEDLKFEIEGNISPQDGTIFTMMIEEK